MGKTLIHVLFVLICLMPFASMAGDDISTNDEVEITNHAMIAAVAALEQSKSRFTPEYNEMIGRIADLESNGPWHGNLTYRSEFVNGGPYDGFDHGVRVGLDYREHVADNLLLNIQMLFDSNNELFDRQAQYGGNHVYFDEAYFKYSN